MASITQIRNEGTSILTPPRPIYEPLNAPTPFDSKLERFEDNYDLSTSSHLYRFLLALCGDSGAGALKRWMLYPKLQLGLESTHFSDLDSLFGNPLALSRLPEETYTFDPMTQTLTALQWQEALSKDASYRGRCLLWMRAILEGPTPLGISFAAEAASGVPCDVVEEYVYQQNLASDLPLTMTNYGATSSNNEFVIIPRTAVLTQVQQKRITQLVDRLRPVNTLYSITTLGDPHIPVIFNNVDATSEYFTVTRIVTGRPDIVWPTVDPSKGYWIIANVPVEAPQFAWFQSQEATTFLSITGATASSVHVGQFDPDQQAVFGNLQNTDPNFVYSEQYSYSKAFAPIQLSSPWLPFEGAPTVVNNYYPLDYFANSSLAQVPNQDPRTFWASEEKYAPVAETLVLNFGTPRPFNYLDLEITQKPIDLFVEYSLDGITWMTAISDDTYSPQMSTSYRPSLDSPWIYLENHFELVSAQFVRITFTRRSDVFPLANSLSFRWSVEVRNLHAAHYIPSSDLFFSDAGVDILGNSYTTSLNTLGVANLNSGTSFWQSQPNPVPDAVEALYFDLRINAQPGTMTYLDFSDRLQAYDTRGVGDLENYLTTGVTFDEIYIDPVTTGPYMHVYWSNDDDPDWDNKLWTPIMQTYILRKGYHALPQTITTKYLKLEFSNLNPMPYNVQEYPTAPRVIYRKYPTWVQTYFGQVFDAQLTSNSAFGNFDLVEVDPLVFGFQRDADNFDTSYSQIRQVPPTQTDDEIKAFISNLISPTTDVSNAIQTQQESQINFNPSFMWQQDLLSLLDSSRALSRYIQNSEVSTMVESPPDTLPEPNYQSVPDLTDAQILKQSPIMFFPRICRHSYQEIQGTRLARAAYFVAIKNVQFYRRDYTASFDEAQYFDPLDATNSTQNEFTLNEWSYNISP